MNALISLAVASLTAAAAALPHPTSTAPVPDRAAATASVRGDARQFDAITAALAKGDHATIARYLDNTVELALPGLDDIFTKDQAATKLRGFFGLNPPTGFSRVHGGTSRGDIGAYVIGSLKSGDKTFRVYLYGVGDVSPTIQEIRIEEE